MRTDRVWVAKQLKAGREPTADEPRQYTEELIDLTHDPNETRDIRTKAQFQLRAFRQMLEKRLAVLSQRRSALIDESKITNTITADQIEQLRALGYY